MGLAMAYYLVNSWLEMLVSGGLVVWYGGYFCLCFPDMCIGVFVSDGLFPSSISWV